MRVPFELRERTLIAAASVAASALAVLVALSVGTGPHRVWLTISGLVGVALVFPSLFTDPRELLPALVFSLPPVLALVADPATASLAAPRAVLLLIGAALSALCWPPGGARATGDAGRAHLIRIGQLAVLGLVAGIAVTLAAGLTWLESTAAVVVASASLAGLAGVVFSGASAEAATDTGS